MTKPTERVKLPFFKPFKSVDEFKKPFTEKGFIVPGFILACACINPVGVIATELAILASLASIYYIAKDNADMHDVDSKLLVDTYEAIFNEVCSILRDTGLLPLFILSNLSGLAATGYELVKENQDLINEKIETFSNYISSFFAPDYPPTFTLSADTTDASDISGWSCSK